MRLKAAAVCGAAMAICGQARAEPPPLIAYAADPAISHVEVSPDGSRAAFLRTDGEAKTTILLPASDQPPVQLPLGKLRITGLDWLDPDHLMIIHAAMLQLPDILPRQLISQGFSLNLRTGRGATLLQDTPQVGALLPGGRPMFRGRLNGKPVLFQRALEASPQTTVQFSAYAADAETGRGQLIDRGSLDAENWVLTSDGQLVARSEFNPNSRFWSLWAYGPNGRRLVRREKGEQRPELLGLGRTEGTVAAKQNDDLFEISLADGSKGPSLTPPGATLVQVLMDVRTNRIAGMRVSGDTPTYVFFDPAWKTAWDKVVAAFPGRRVALVTHDDSFSQIVAHVEGPGQPGSFYWVHLNQGRAELLEEERPLIKQDQVGPVSKIDYAAGDGLKLGAYLTLPPGRAAKDLPLVVLVHDGPDSRDTLTFDPEAQALASRGYAVLQVNYRGSTGVASGFQAAGFGEWGRKMQTDLSDGVAYLAAQGTIDPKRVCIMGSGYGGYAALAGVSLQHGVYRCAVAINALWNVPAMIERPDSDMRGPAWDRISLWKKYLGVQRDNDPGVRAVSTLAQAAHADAPVLLVQSSDDQFTKPGQAEAMRGALKAANHPVEYVPLKGGEHVLQTPALRAQMLEAVLRFLQTNDPAQ